MRKVLFLLLVTLIAVSLAGCVTVKKVVKDRVDQDVSGNRGVIQGSEEADYSADRPTTREYIDIKVEVPTWREFKEGFPKRKEAPAKKPVAKKKRTLDRDVSGNRGYLTSGGGIDKEVSYRDERRPRVAVPKKPKPVVYEYEEEEFIPEPVIEKAPPAYVEYTIKEGDTLSHISKRFYDKASKWTVIYEANSDKIKDPARIKPGTVIIIPDLSQAESKYTK